MALAAPVGAISPAENTHLNSTNLQAGLFDLLVSADPSDATDASPDQQSPRIKPTQVLTTPGGQNRSYNSIMLPPGTLPPVRTRNFQPYQHPPALPKLKQLGLSLPNSATSSPRLGHPSLLKKKWRHHESKTSPREGDETPNFAACHGTVSLAEKDLRRSKSCGEGRASSPPSIDFKAVSEKLESMNITRSASPRKPDAGEEIGEGTKEEFKCGALCLFLPGFGKAKPVRAKNKDDEDQSSEPAILHSNIVISRSVSLEKFECGSWASSAIVTDSKNNDEAENSTNLYFDLPLELIRSSGNDANSPVTAAFIFENTELRGVLKAGCSTRTGASSARKSRESSRHVRFSTSTSPRSNPESPSSCITPRLRKAREDFNALLAAQSA